MIIFFALVMLKFHLRYRTLIQEAIIESGSFYDMPCNSNISAIIEANYQSFLNYTNCSNFDCLRTLDNEVLFNASLVYFEDSLPSIDGEFMQKHPVELFEEGKFVVGIFVDGRFVSCSEV